MITSTSLTEAVAAPSQSHVTRWPDSDLVRIGKSEEGVVRETRRGSLDTHYSPPISPSFAPHQSLTQAGPTAKATKDHPFDPYLAVSAERAEAIDELFQMCNRTERPRKRARRQLDAMNYCAVLGVVVANTVRAAHHPTSNRVHYSRRRCTYSHRSHYCPAFLSSTTLLAVVDTLSAMGFLSRGRWSNEFDDLPLDPDGPERQQSTFEVTMKFIEWLDARDIGPWSLTKLEGSPVVVLRDKDKNDISYDSTQPYVASVITAITAWNRFVSSVQIGLDLSEADLEAMHQTPQRDGQPRPPINFMDKSLCRIFNNETFEHGGRFCRGWWINVPSEYRRHLLIDGQKTVELDYSGFYLRMLYHLAKLDLKGDPYVLEPIMEAARAQALSWESVRGAVKRLTNIYINALPGSKIGHFPEYTRHLPKGFRRPEYVYNLIAQKHARIADKFRSGAGYELMRYESDICADVLKDGMDTRNVVLPIYDSFIVQVGHADWLKQAMTEHYRKRFGFLPVISEKV